MRARSSAQALVEFALVAPLLVLLVFGTVDIGRAVFAFTTLSEAAELGARAVVPGLPPGFPKPTNAEVIDAVRARSGGLALAPAVNCDAATDTERPPVGTGWIYINPLPPNEPCAAIDGLDHQQVRVTVRYSFAPVTPGIVQVFGGGIVLAASAVYTTEQ